MKISSEKIDIKKTILEPWGTQLVKHAKNTYIKKKSNKTMKWL